MFQIGEVVSYGASGICTIEDIRMESLSRSGVKKQEYYILRPAAAPTCVTYVPTSSEKLTAKMRRVMTKAEIDAMLLAVRGQRKEWSEDTRRRTEVFTQILTGGISEELLKLIGCLYLEKKNRSQGSKKFCATDEKLLSSAERLVGEEFSYALQIPQKEVSAYIANRMGGEPV